MLKIHWTRCINYAARSIDLVNIVWSTRNEREPGRSSRVTIFVRLVCFVRVFQGRHGRTREFIIYHGYVRTLNASCSGVVVFRDKWGAINAYYDNALKYLDVRYLFLLSHFILWNLYDIHIHSKSLKLKLNEAFDLQPRDFHEFQYPR